MNTSVLQLWISNAIIVVAVLAAVLGLANFLLSEQCKLRIEAGLHWLWNWLDDAKKMSLLSGLRRSKPAIYGTGVMLTVALLVFAYRTRDASFDQPISVSMALQVTAFVLFGVWCGYFVVSTTLKASTLLGALARATLFALLIYAPVQLYLIWVASHMDFLMPVDGMVTLAQMLFLISFVSLTLLTALAALWWLAVAAPIALIYFSSGLLFISELVVRRMAESKTGVLLISSAFFVGVGALLKVIS